MEILCRSCLLAEKDMVALDESCVTSYNLLTNLQIVLGDEMPQNICQNCFNMIKVFMDFRQKAIVSETTLRNIKENELNNFCDKEENVESECIRRIESLDDDYDDALTYETIYSGDDEETCLKSTYKLSDVKKEHVQMLQCGLCKKYIPNSDALEDHLKEHKRGGKCKLCFENIKIAELYAHTLAHHQFSMDIKQESNTYPEIKLENLNSGYIKTRSTVKVKRKLKNANGCIKRNEVESESPILNCGLCRLKFDDKDLLLNHLENHKTEGTSICEICQEFCNSWPQLLGHRVLHLPPTQRSCHLCDRRFRTQNNLEFHYRRMHYDGEDKNLKCKHCLRSYGSPRKLTKHLNSVHAPKRYFCDHCAKGFINKSNLRSHLASHGQGKRYMCDECDFSSKLRQGLKHHKLRKHQPVKFTCKMCSKIFIDKTKHDEHVCKSNGGVCPLCGKVFNNKKSLTRHSHSHDAEPRYKCGRCAAAYRSRNALRVHIDRHDGVKKQRCEYCGARFYSYTVLLKHRRVHTGEKPYVCKICSRGFTGNHNLKVHMRIHGEDVIVKRNKATDDSKPANVLENSAALIKYKAV